MKSKGLPFYDLTGHKYGKLTVIGLLGVGKGGAKWLCKCDCGNTTEAIGAKLKIGHKKSCGCIVRIDAPKARTRHGHALASETSRTYRIWCNMKHRCSNPNNPDYEYYGGKGVVVCDRWVDSYENFLSDMGECPPGHSIDRINNNGIYEPSNCRWAAQSEQRRNTGSNITFTINGETKVLADWADAYGVKRSTAYARASRGEEISVILSAERSNKKVCDVPIGDLVPKLSAEVQKTMF